MEVIDQPSVESATVEEHAGFWMRLGAMIIDGLILAPVTLGLTYFNVSGWKSTEVLILLSLIGIIYKPFMEAKYGATLGKMALKLRVVNADYEQASTKEAVLRNIFHLTFSILSFLLTLYIYQDPAFADVDGWSDYSALTQTFIGLQAVSGLSGLITIVDGIVLVADDKKRSIHDKIGGTLVIVQ